MKLLVVEDELDIREVLCMSLADDGYAVDSAEDGEIGLYKALNWDYDVILLDIMMPKIDGWEVLRQLREEKKTPVLMLTALGQIDDRVKGLDLGSDDFVVKPFDMEELSARIRAIIRRSAGQANTVLKCNKLSVDTSRREVKLGNKNIQLTAIEYSLLEYMIMHQDRIVTRTDLYEHLFDENDDSFSNTLDVHICNIRHKIGSSYIKTKRGQGYMMGEDK